MAVWDAITHVTSLEWGKKSLEMALHMPYFCWCLHVMVQWGGAHVHVWCQVHGWITLGDLGGLDGVKRMWSLEPSVHGVSFIYCQVLKIPQAWLWWLGLLEGSLWLACAVLFALWHKVIVVICSHSCFDNTWVRSWRCGCLLSFDGKTS